MHSPRVQAFFHPDTWTVTYVVADPATSDAVIIDPVLDYDVLSSQTDTAAADELVRFIRHEGLVPRAILETHAHADHVSAARYLAEVFGTKVAIGRGITTVQKTFSRVFGFEGRVATDGSQFDLLLDDGQNYHFGSIEMQALATPGHTPACMSFLIGDAVFTGDALFMHDYGTGRTDFPAGSAEQLYDSVHRVLYGLADDTRVFVGHDYQPGGREVAWESSIAREKGENVQLSSATTLDDFVTFRTQRDKKLRPPRLIFQSIQINVFGGALPDEEENGMRYLKIPLNMKCRTDVAGKPLDARCASPLRAAE